MTPFNFFFVMPLDPVTGSALISAGSNLLSGLLGSLGQKSSNKAYLQGVNDTNATNLAIARETNRQNLDLFNAQNRFTENMWAKTNDYNSPMAARARLVAAGVSPSQMANSGQASVVQSAVGQPAQAAKMEAPQPLPSDLQPLAQSIGGAANDFLNAQYLKEQIHFQKLQNYNLGVQNEFVYQEKMNSLQKEIFEVRNLQLSNEEKDMRLGFLYGELRDLQTMRSQQMHLNDLSADGLIASAENTRANTGLVSAQIQQAFASIRQADRKLQIEAFNAATGRIVADAQVKRMESDTVYQDMLNDILSADKWYIKDMNKKAYYYRDKIMQLDEKAQQAMLDNLLLNSEVAQRMDESALRHFINVVFGIDVQNLVGAAAGWISRGFSSKGVPYRQQPSNFSVPVDWSNP